MVNPENSQKTIFITSLLKGALSLTFLFLLIEFFDELNYGVGNAALPAIRSDLGLTYIEIGLLLGLPGVINTFIEPVLMLLGDTRYRKRIMLGGGLAIILSLLAIASTHSFLLVLIGMVIGFPASGAFVSLSQATLMDQNPGREPQMMARWTVAGSIANLIGPLILAGGFALGFGWRWAFFAMAAMCLVLVVITWKRRIPIPPAREQSSFGRKSIYDLAQGLWQAARNPRLMRWLILVQFSDLLLDVLTGYLPLYFTDVTGFSIAQASLMMSVLMAAGLVSNIVLIPLLERFHGRKVVRLSAAVTGVLYAAWLLAPWLWVKVALIIIIKLVTLGWYEVLQGEAFASIPGRSGTVMALNSAIGALGGGISFLVGWVAARAGLPAAMWILLIGPVSLVLFVPSYKPVVHQT
ncbi:MAG TPA: MFS transporter [Anaerolineales bacterium]|nr:MFS transporter [Anaerolineales bacterium]